MALKNKETPTLWTQSGSTSCTGQPGAQPAGSQCSPTCEVSTCTKPEPAPPPQVVSATRTATAAPPPPISKQRPQTPPFCKVFPRLSGLRPHLPPGLGGGRVLGLRSKAAPHPGTFPQARLSSQPHTAPYLQPSPPRPPAGPLAVGLKEQEGGWRRQAVGQPRALHQAWELDGGRVTPVHQYGVTRRGGEALLSPASSGARPPPASPEQEVGGVPRSSGLAQPPPTPRRQGWRLRGSCALSQPAGQRRRSRTCQATRHPREGGESEHPSSSHGAARG